MIIWVKDLPNDGHLFTETEVSITPFCMKQKDFINAVKFISYEQHLKILNEETEKLKVKPEPRAYKINLRGKKYSVSASTYMDRIEANVQQGWSFPMAVTLAGLAYSSYKDMTYLSQDPRYSIVRERSKKKQIQAFK